VKHGTAIGANRSEVDARSKAILSTSQRQWLLVVNVNEATTNRTVTFLETHPANSASQTMPGNACRSCCWITFVCVHGHSSQRTLGKLRIVIKLSGKFASGCVVRRCVNDGNPFRRRLASATSASVKRPRNRTFRTLPTPLNANGVPSSSPGLARSDCPGSLFPDFHNPERVASSRRPNLPQPIQSLRNVLIAHPG
jgi:hypothetical protein